MRIRVTARHWRAPGGELFSCGDVVDADDADAQRLIKAGAAEEAGPASVEPAKASGKPGRNSPAQVWKDYARSQGVDPDGKSKREIIAAVG